MKEIFKNFEIRFKILRVQNLLIKYLLKKYNLNNDFYYKIANDINRLLRKIFSQGVIKDVDELMFFFENSYLSKNIKGFFNFEKELKKLNIFISITEEVFLNDIRKIIIKYNIQKTNFPIISDEISDLIIMYILKKYNFFQEQDNRFISKVNIVNVESFAEFYATFQSSSLSKIENLSLIGKGFSFAYDDNYSNFLKKTCIIVNYLFNLDNLYDIWNELFIEYFLKNQDNIDEVVNFKKISTILFNNKFQKNITIRNIMSILKNHDSFINKFFIEKLTILDKFYSEFQLNISKKIINISFFIKRLFFYVNELFGLKDKDISDFNGFLLNFKNKHDFFEKIIQILNDIFRNIDYFELNSKNFLIVNDKLFNFQQLLIFTSASENEVFIIDKKGSELICFLKKTYNLEVKEYKTFLKKHYMVSKEVFKNVEFFEPNLDVKYKNIKLSPSSVKKIIQNPYFFYLEKVLNIKIDEIDDFFDNFDLNIGNIAHKIIEIVSSDFMGKLINNVDIIDQYIDFELNKYNANYFDKKTIFPKIKNFILNFVEIHNESVSTSSDVFFEKEISCFIDDEIEIVSKPDRYELKNGFVKIFDYKSGSSFSILDELRGENIQLFFSALILLKKEYKISDIFYISLKDRKKDASFLNSNLAKKISIYDSIMIVERNIIEIINHFFKERNVFNYKDRLNLNYKNYIFYEHLSRLKNII